MSSPELISNGPAQLQRRVLALGSAALEGTRELSDVLGDAFQELRSAVASIHRLELQLQQKEEMLAALRAQREAPRSPALPEEAPPLVLTLAGSEPAEIPARQDVVEPEETLDLLDGPVPGHAPALAALLRERIAGALYLGLLRPGDRLPSIRDLARRSGLNHKTIRRVYQDLEKQGLVTVRDRSGIYVNQTEPPLEESLEETESWVARVLAEATERGMRTVDLPTMLRRWTSSRPLRCACVESTHDDRVALCQEIGERFGIEAVPVSAAGAELARQLRDVDFVVTTPFHAAEVRAALGPLRPLIVTGPDPQARSVLRKGLETGDCVVACVDPAFADRLLNGVPFADTARVHVLALGSGPEVPVLPPSTVGVATRAAWQKLGGGAPLAHVCVPPYLSARAARDIAGMIVRLNRANAVQ